jgi:hypothetical protein
MHQSLGGPHCIAGALSASQDGAHSAPATESPLSSLKPYRKRSIFAAVLLLCGFGTENHRQTGIETRLMAQRRNPTKIEGNLPRRQARLVLAWAELHRDELLADGRLAINGEIPAQIDPLK